MYRRSQHVLRAAQHVRAHHHVLVLHVGRHWSTNAKVPLVEEILDCAPNGTKILLLLFQHIVVWVTTHSLQYTYGCI